MLGMLPVAPRPRTAIKASVLWCEYPLGRTGIPTPRARWFRPGRAQDKQQGVGCSPKLT